MKKTILFTQKKEIIKSIDTLTLEYETISDATLLFEYSFDSFCVILFDLDSFEDDFRDFFIHLKKELPGVKVLAVRMNIDVLEGIDLLKYGVKGYGNSLMQPIHLQQALDVVCEGNIWIYPELAVYMIQQTPTSNSSVDALSEMNQREKEIINFVCQGMRNKEIASMLSLSEISVKKILTNIYRKLHLKDRIEMIALFNR